MKLTKRLLISCGDLGTSATVEPLHSSLESEENGVESKLRKLSRAGYLTFARRKDAGAIANKAKAGRAISRRKCHSACAGFRADLVHRPSFGSVERVDRHRRKRPANCAQQIFVAVSPAENRE